jgi:hypothetical protein
MGVQLDAERADFLVQLEHLKGQVHEKECKVQDIEEQECILAEGPEKENGAEEASVANHCQRAKNHLSL